MGHILRGGRASFRSAPSILGVLWSCILVSATESPAQDRPSATRAGIAAERLAWDLESRTSVELRTTYEIVPAKVDPQRPAAYDQVEDHYIEAVGGRRTCDSRFLKSGVAVQRIARFSDGSKCADVNYTKGDPERQQSVVIKRQYAMEDRSERPERPHPLQLLYVGREPLSKALLKATYLGEGRALDRTCDLFLFSKVRWEVVQDHVYYLDGETSIPLKVESYKDQTAREAKKPLWVWTSESFDRVHGRSVPFRSKLVAFDEAAEPAVTWLYRVQSIEFDKVFPSSTFWPVLQPGVSVLDTLSKKSYRVPGADAGTPDVSPEILNISQRIEATPPSDWSQMVSSMIFALGSVVLVVGVVLWRRR